MRNLFREWNGNTFGAPSGAYETIRDNADRPSRPFTHWSRFSKGNRLQCFTFGIEGALRDSNGAWTQVPPVPWLRYFFGVSPFDHFGAPPKGAGSGRGKQVKSLPESKSRLLPVLTGSISLSGSRPPVDTGGAQREPELSFNIAPSFGVTGARGFPQHDRFKKGLSYGEKDRGDVSKLGRVCGGSSQGVPGRSTGVERHVPGTDTTGIRKRCFYPLSLLLAGEGEATCVHDKPKRCRQSKLNRGGERE